MDSVLLLTDLVAVWLDLASQGCSSAKSWIAFINNQTCCTAGRNLQIVKKFTGKKE